MKLRIQIFIFTVIRVVTNVATRMAYPFLGVFARGLGVDVTTLSLVVSSRSFVAIFIPFVTSIFDRRGRKFGMMVGIGVFSAVSGLVILRPSLVTLSVALIVGLVGKYVFDTAMQAYLGDRIPYERRGLALSITETAWSIAFIGGIPLVGFLISKYGWSAPFPALSILGLVSLAAIWWFVAPDDARHTSSEGPWANIRTVLTHRTTLIAISICMFASAANEMVNLIFGVWLEDKFALKIAALGAASAVIGLSELGGEGLVAMLTDRLGKTRAIMAGLIASALATVALPFLGTTQAGALVGLFFFYIAFEFVIVSHIPMMTEMLPSARVAVMSFNMAGHSTGRLVGSLLAAFVYKSFGFGMITSISLGLNVLALGALFLLQKTRSAR